MKQYLLYLFSVILIFLFTLQARSQYIQNPSLESSNPEGDMYPPDFWNTDDSWSDADNLESYQSSDNILYKAYDGIRFAILRARGKYYMREVDHAPFQREYLYQQLENPLEGNSCFTFSAYLCANQNYQVNDSLEKYNGYPVKFQVWGSNRPNKRDYLLVDSDPITNLDWEKKSYNFTTPSVSLEYLLIEVNWDTIKIKEEPYNGLLLVDSLGLIKSGIADTIGTHTEYYKGDYKTILTAAEGQGYSWNPIESVVDYTSRSTIIKEYQDQFIVNISSDNGCGQIEIFNLIYNCDTVHPVTDTSTTNVYYNYNNQTQLVASKGISYDWQPPDNLSANNIQSPVLLGFQPQFIVNVVDPYSCSFAERFNVLINCDTLFPEKTFMVLDTLVQYNSMLTLNTYYPEFQTSWNPNEYLSCTDCSSPIASPYSSTQYTATLTDNFGCVHFENFYVEVAIRVPNVITPNGDGFNDCFKVFAIPENTSLSIFDSKNQLVYDNENYGPDDCWDGTDMNGNTLRADTYWYTFYHSSRKSVQKGFILLVR